MYESERAGPARLSISIAEFSRVGWISTKMAGHRSRISTTNRARFSRASTQAAPMEKNVGEDTTTVSAGPQARARPSSVGGPPVPRGWRSAADLHVVFSLVGAARPGRRPRATSVYLYTEPAPAPEELP